MANAATIHPQSAATRIGINRWAGLAGLAFAVSVAALNVIIPAAGLQPAPDASASEVLTKISDNRDQLAVTFGLVALNVVLLGVFIAGIVERVGDAAPIFARVGLLGGIGVLLLFPLSIVPIVVIASSGDELAASPALVSVLWDLHFAMFALVHVVLGLGLLGLSVAAARAKLVPGWFAVVGPIGALFLVAGTLPLVEAAQGSMAVMSIGLPGFVAWLVFAGTAGVKMWREA